MRLASHLKEKVKEVAPPPWSLFSKTGPAKKRPPDDPDWWYLRTASILRKLYVGGPVGVSRLRSIYGSRKDYPMRKAHRLKSGGSNIRNALQQLEKAGLVGHNLSGHYLTDQGRSLIDQISIDLVKGVPGR